MFEFYMCRHSVLINIFLKRFNEYFFSHLIDYIYSQFHLIDEKNETKFNNNNILLVINILVQSCILINLFIGKRHSYESLNAKKVLTTVFSSKFHR